MGIATAVNNRWCLERLSDAELDARVRVRQSVWEDCEEEKCMEGDGIVPGPLYWMQNHTKTHDEHWLEKGTKPDSPFPDKPYFPWLVWHLMNDRRQFIPKSREMMATWLLIGYGAWKAQFFPTVQVIVQTQKDEKVVDLIKGRGTPGYARTLYEQQPAWLKGRHPLTKAMKDLPEDLISWANGSSIRGVPKGADQIRQYHPTIVIFDEAAHLDEFRESYGAAEPVCSQIIAVSSAAPSFFGDICVEAWTAAHNPR